MSAHPAARLAAPAALLLLLAQAGCAPAPGTPGAAVPAGNIPAYVKTVHPEEVDLWRGVNYQGLLLDVRSPDEYDDATGLLEEATKIPLGELEQRMSEIERMKGRPALVFDMKGPRGQAGAQILARAGFADVGWIDGGLEAYARALTRR